MFKMKNNSKLHFCVKYRMSICIDGKPSNTLIYLYLFLFQNPKSNFCCWKHDFRASRGTKISKNSGHFRTFQDIFALYHFLFQNPKSNFCCWKHYFRPSRGTKISKNKEISGQLSKNGQFTRTQ